MSNIDLDSFLEGQHYKTVATGIYRESNLAKCEVDVYIQKDFDSLSHERNKLQSIGITEKHRSGLKLTVHLKPSINVSK